MLVEFVGPAVFVNFCRPTLSVAIGGLHVRFPCTTHGDALGARFLGQRTVNKKKNPGLGLAGSLPTGAFNWNG